MIDAGTTDLGATAAPTGGGALAPPHVWAARAALARHLPERAGGTLALLGEGMDNVAYLADGDLVVRVGKMADPAARAAAIRREAAVLAIAAAVSPLPVPEPLVADPALGVIAYPMLPGRPLMDAPVADPRRLAAPLGVLLARLHTVPLADVRCLVDRVDYPLEDWRDDAADRYWEFGPTLPPPARHAVERFLAAPLPVLPAALVFTHDDLGAKHILVDDATGHVTGVIDWADAALADPMVDFARIYRDLGPIVADLTYAAYASARGDDAPWPAADRDRAAFYARCTLLADLAYGLGPGSRRFADTALAHLPRTFA